MIEHLEGDCRPVLPTLPARTIQCCITSPAYFQLIRQRKGDDVLITDPMLWLNHWFSGLVQIKMTKLMHLHDIAKSLSFGDVEAQFPKSKP